MILPIENTFETPELIEADERKCRVFISYTHSDVALALLVEEIIKQLGHTPLRDAIALTSGDDFSKKLQRYIGSAHFMAVVVTTRSVGSAWMEQEIGYAIAHRVPFIPIMFGVEPPGMLASYHGVSVDPKWDQDQMKQLIAKEMLKVLKGGRSPEQTEGALYQCALQPEERGSMMVAYAKSILDTGHHTRIRQFGGLSSFHIPLHPTHHPMWAARYHPSSRTEYYIDKQRAERVAFEAHARVAGCRLIIDPNYKHADFDESAWKVRLLCLIEFLESMPDSHCEVAINPQQQAPESRTLAGSWFYCSSFAYARTGNYRQTIFTRHAPTVAKEVRRFDDEFHYFLNGLPPSESRNAAITKLAEFAASLQD
jgi:hypothetical protein